LQHISSPTQPPKPRTQWWTQLQREQDSPGSCYFPIHESYDPRYFAQLTAEKCVTRYTRGFPRREWVKVRARNEVLDCRVYAMAALYILNPAWGVLAKRLEQKQSPREAPPAKPPGRAARFQRRRRGFVHSWREGW
jgi:phage terminase large subunit GpA-like protein